jgi:hypothetical protein
MAQLPELLRFVICYMINIAQSMLLAVSVKTSWLDSNKWYAPNEEVHTDNGYQKACSLLVSDSFVKRHECFHVSNLHDCRFK